MCSVEDCTASEPSSFRIDSLGRLDAAAGLGQRPVAEGSPQGVGVDRPGCPDQSGRERVVRAAHATTSVLPAVLDEVVRAPFGEA